MASISHLQALATGLRLQGLTVLKLRMAERLPEDKMVVQQLHGKRMDQTTNVYIIIRASDVAINTRCPFWSCEWLSARPKTRLSSSNCTAHKWVTR